MKKELFLLALVAGLAACSPPKEVSVPNENLKFENGAVLYKSEPYSGKITSNPSDAAQGYSGFLNLKNGHLDGLSEMKGKDGERIQLNVENGKLEGDYIVEYPNAGKTHINFKGGVPKVMKTEAPGITQDITVADDGKVNGTMSMQGKNLTLKDGVAEMGGVTLKMNLQNDGTLLTEVYQGDKLLQKNQASTAVPLDALEKKLFSSVLNK